MAKKDTELEVIGESKWDGRMLTSLGKLLLQILVLAIFCGTGLYLGCMNIVGQGGTWIEDIQNPTTLVYVVIGAGLCGIGFCWACIIGLKYNIKHRIVCGQRLQFNANTINLVFNCIKWVILSAITCGIYLIWLPTKIRKWACKHTTFAPEVEEEVEEEEEVEYPITYYTVDDEGNYEEMIFDDDEDEE